MTQNPDAEIRVPPDEDPELSELGYLFNLGGGKIRRKKMTLLPYCQELCLSSFCLPNPFNFICPVKTTIATTKLQMFDRNSIFDIYLGSGKQFRTDDSKHTLTLLTSETF